MATKLLDISFWQATLDFAKIKKAGYDNIILRAGYRTTIDPKFNEYANACKKNKINIVGVYWFMYATNLVEVRANANKCLEVIKAYKPKIVFVDFEYDTIYKAAKKGVKLGAKECDNFTIEFCETVKKAGYIPGYYANMEFYNKMYSSKVKNKGYAFWLAHYNSNYSYHEPPVKCDFFQYTDRGTIPGLIGKIFDMDVCLSEKYLSKTSTTSTNTSNNNSNKTPQGGDNMSNNIVQNIINDAVSFAVGIANDNSHGYSQAVRSLYNISVPKSFDCSSLCCTSYYYAFLKNGLTEQANYLKSHCSYTGNMLNMLNVGFEIVAKNQTAHAQMQKGDLELNENYHVAMAIDRDNIVHARSSEGTTNTIDDSGNEIRTQPWYNYSHGWTHRLRFTGKGLNLNSSTNTSTTVTKNWIEYGDKGNDVKTLQTKLNKVGYKLEVNGICGNATVAAIKDFQTKYNLAVDGQAGKNTITKLDSVIAAKENKNFKAFVGACTTDGTSVYQKATGATALATYPKLNRGNLVDVIGISGSRYKIKIANAYTGYIDKAKITTPDKLTKSEYPYVGKCTGNDVAVRKDAGTSYAKISGYPTLNKDNKVDVLGVKKDSSGNEWKQVKIANKYVGYVFGKYITRV